MSFYSHEFSVVIVNLGAIFYTKIHLSATYMHMNCYGTVTCILTLAATIYFFVFVSIHCAFKLKKKKTKKTSFLT